MKSKDLWGVCLTLPVPSQARPRHREAQPGQDVLEEPGSSRGEAIAQAQHLATSTPHAPATDLAQIAGASIWPVFVGRLMVRQCAPKRSALDHRSCISPRGPPAEGHSKHQMVPPRPARASQATRRRRLHDTRPTDAAPGLLAAAPLVLGSLERPTSSQRQTNFSTSSPSTACDQAIQEDTPSPAPSVLRCWGC